MGTTATPSKYDEGLAPRDANFVPLSPIQFLERSAHVYPEKTAVVHGERRLSYATLYERCRRLAGALTAAGVGKGDTVSVLAPNIPALLEAHYGVPMSGAVLNALNVRLDPPTIAFILRHAETKVLIVDRDWRDVAEKALEACEWRPYVVDIDDPDAEDRTPFGDIEYESFLSEATPAAEPFGPDEEWQAIALNYTSGTTGNPKGVVYHHRGAYLNALSNVITFRLQPESVYLWTLPMFHCNGWSHTWAVTAAGATHVCLRKVDPALIYPLIGEARVTHMSGAPIILNMLAHAPDSLKAAFDQRVMIATGGAAPPSAIIERMEDAGFEVLHLYGLTESYGPSTVCAWQPEWDGLNLRGRSEKMARQGVEMVAVAGHAVMDPETMEPVPADGKTMGELMLRSNTIMKGYLKNEQASEEAFAGGWFHTGDLAVVHPDGYVEMKDRSKDVIISGGENISSLEVEEALYRHPKVLEAAVVAKPDETWGESPCAFVTLKDGEDATAEEIMDYCRGALARFKVPRTVVFGPLPKTATGKIQKFVLRERAKEE